MNATNLYKHGGQRRIRWRVRHRPIEVRKREFSRFRDVEWRFEDDDGGRRIDRIARAERTVATVGEIFAAVTGRTFERMSNGSQCVRTTQKK